MANHVNSYRFQRLPEELLFAFFDILYKYRGDFIQRVDNLVGPSVTQFVAGQRPERPATLEGWTKKRMREQPMDSEYFVGLSRTLISCMP
jgi:hypothetical protein